MTLSKQQFQGLVNDLHDPENGGFSVDMQGQSPSGGFMVAKPGHEKSIGIDHVSASHLESYVNRGQRPAVLNQPNTYFGGWHDRSRGMVDLDVSQHIPDDPKVTAEYGEDVAHADARTSALDLSIARNQRAAFDLKTFDDVPNPDFRKPKKGERR